MAATVKDLPKLIPSSSGSLFTNGIGHLDDASSITLFLASSANANSSALIIQISQFDPADPFPQSGITQSSGWFNVSSSNVYSTAAAISISNVSFRGLRFSITTSNAGEIIATACKQISV